MSLKEEVPRAASAHKIWRLRKRNGVYIILKDVSRIELIFYITFTSDKSHSRKGQAL